MFYSLIKRNSRANRKENSIYFVSTILAIIAFYVILSLLLSRASLPLCCLSQPLQHPYAFVSVVSPPPASQLLPFIQIIPPAYKYTVVAHSLPSRDLNATSTAIIFLYSLSQ